MKNSARILLAGFAAAALVAPVTASVAGTDIGWTWNSTDRDVRGKFVSSGDDFKAEEHNGNGYLDWSASGHGSGRWFVPGSATGTEKTLDMNFTEGKVVTLKVCEEKGNWPDDCSAQKNGVA